MILAWASPFNKDYIDNDKDVIMELTDGIVRDLVYTVDLVIFACLNFREFLILGLFTKLWIRRYFFSSAIIVIIFARFFNSQMLPDLQ